MQTSLTNTVCFPYLIEDMVVVLSRCMSDPPRLKADHVSFLKKTEDELGRELIELPAQIAALTENSPKERLAEAVRFLINVRLATKAGMSSKSMSLVISELGHRWLNTKIEQRLEPVYKSLKTSHKKITTTYINTFRFAPAPIPIMLKRRDLDLTDSLVQLFRAVAVGDTITYSEFIDSLALQSNPLHSLACKSGALALTIGPDHSVRTAEERNRIWIEYVKAFLFGRLFALGAVRFGFTQDGQLAFSLNSCVEFLLDQSENFEYNSANDEKLIMVQPDFDIIFLSPSPVVEARINAFAERLASGIGVLFKITRSSIMNAASIEISADEVLATLADHSLQPVPANVEAEIRNWFGQCRFISGKEVYLINCPDRETAMRVIDVAGSSVSQISDLVLSLDDASQKVSFLKKMKTHGIFLA